jgi:ParB family transcriptional regulator, chromosome partitioning protein
MARQALGKGLGALIGGGPSAVPAPGSGDAVRRVPLARVVSSPLQPRKQFTEGEIVEMAASIKERGILQPLLVREVGGKFELIAGERRWRAAQRAGLSEVPVMVRVAGDQEVLEIAMVENLQRADLNPVEEAEGYVRLAGQFQLTQEQIAQKVGKSRAAVANAMRLMQLSPELLDLLRHGRLSTGHAKALLGLTDKAGQNVAMRQVLAGDLNVRQTEALVKRILEGRRGGNKKSKGGKRAGADWRDIEQQAQRALGTKVRLVGTAEKGRMEIEYFSAADLERILEKLGVGG